MIYVTKASEADIRQLLIYMIMKTHKLSRKILFGDQKLGVSAVFWIFLSLSLLQNVLAY